MAKIEISAGKLRGITKLADANGRFKMMAIDQRGSMVSALAKTLNKPEADVTYAEVAEVKTLITRVLAPNATAVLTDPEYGYPYSVMELPRDVALLLAFEKSGYVKEGVGEKERASVPIENWSVEKARRAGADAIKLLVYYHPDASEAACRHQQDFVRSVGKACEENDLPFLVELVAYAITEGSTKSIAFAMKKPDLVTRSVKEFSKPEYRIDILKLEFPADLKYTDEYRNRSFYAGASAYDLSEVRDVCKQLNEASALPWVILSAGVDIEEFIENVKLTTVAGASGFLCGRAIWKDAVDCYPDTEAMVKFLEGEATENFKNANATAANALPWFAHRKFGGLENVGLAKQRPTWYRDY